LALSAFGANRTAAAYRYMHLVVSAAVSASLPHHQPICSRQYPGGKFGDDLKLGLYHDLKRFARELHRKWISTSAEVFTMDVQVAAGHIRLDPRDLGFVIVAERDG
jgi:hypothetical protein